MTTCIEHACIAMIYEFQILHSNYMVLFYHTDVVTSYTGKQLGV